MRTVYLVERTIHPRECTSHFKSSKMSTEVSNILSKEKPNFIMNCDNDTKEVVEIMNNYARYISPELKVTRSLSPFIIDFDLDEIYDALSKERPTPKRHVEETMLVQSPISKRLRVPKVILP